MRLDSGVRDLTESEFARSEKRSLASFVRKSISSSRWRLYAKSRVLRM